MPGEAEHWPRVTQLARAKGASSDAGNWCCFTHHAHCLPDADEARKRTWGPEVGHTGFERSQDKRWVF